MKRQDVFYGDYQMRCLKIMFGSQTQKTPDEPCLCVCICVSLLLICIFHERGGALLSKYERTLRKL